MPDEPKEPIHRDDAELEKEILANRKFSLADAIGRLGGGNLMKGASPVTRKRQAELEIEHYLEGHLLDAEAALRIVLLRRVADGEILLQMGYQQSLDALALCSEQILSSEEALLDFVCEVDAQWGRMYGERPFFEKPGRPPDPADPYTVASVRAALSRLIEHLRGG